MFKPDVIFQKFCGAATEQESTTETGCQLNHVIGGKTRTEKRLQTSLHLTKTSPTKKLMKVTSQR